MTSNPGFQRENLHVQCREDQAAFHSADVAATEASAAEEPTVSGDGGGASLALEARGCRLVGSG
jgi:hypothetical protein